MTEHEAYEAYDEFINEMHREVEIMGCTYEPARVLKEIDPIAYRTGFNDWADAEGIDTDELT